MPSPSIELHDATPGDFPAILALNAGSVEVLSPLDPERLALLHAQSAYCRVARMEGGVAGFPLALREGAAYDSENYRWFDARYPRFLYIDRVVVDRAARGSGFGRRLYEDLFAFARRDGVALVTCEYDVEPYNAASAAFHARFGFHEAATQVLASGKRVSLQAAPVDDHR